MSCLTNYKMAECINSITLNYLVNQSLLKYTIFHYMMCRYRYVVGIH